MSSHWQSVPFYEWCILLLIACWCVLDWWAFSLPGLRAAFACCKGHQKVIMVLLQCTIIMECPWIQSMQSLYPFVFATVKLVVGSQTTFKLHLPSFLQVYPSCKEDSVYCRARFHHGYLPGWQSHCLWRSALHQYTCSIVSVVYMLFLLEHAVFHWLFWLEYAVEIELMPNCILSPSQSKVSAVWNEPVPEVAGDHLQTRQWKPPPTDKQAALCQGTLVLSMEPFKNIFWLKYTVFTVYFWLLCSSLNLYV